LLRGGGSVEQLDVQRVHWRRDSCARARHFARNGLQQAAAGTAVLGGDERTAALPPISDDFIPALRADAQGGELSVAAALPLMTTAANIGELEMTLS
jgi:hypothetical protein